MSNYCKGCYELEEELQKNERLKEEIKRIAEMRICYENNLKLCKFQEQQINKLATKLEKIIKICEEAIRLCDCADADVNYDCIDCTDGGRASLAKQIMEV